MGAKAVAEALHGRGPATIIGRVNTGAHPGDDYREDSR